MGYDMYWKTWEAPPEVVEAKAAATAAFHGAIEGREALYVTDDDGARRIPDESKDAYEAAQAVVDEAYAKLTSDEVEPNYWRLNIWGMGIAREVLWFAGILYEHPESEYAEWPKPEEFGLDDYPELDVYDQEAKTWSRREPTEAEARFFAAREQHQAARGDQAGIPIHKFGSNDDWWVTADECRQAVGLWGGVDVEALIAELADRDAFDPEKERTREMKERMIGIAGDFVAWMGRAAEHEGFTVR